MRKNFGMRQLQFFTTVELAKMRDRTARRNYSEVAEEFRRTHRRDRARGLPRRHPQRLYHAWQHGTDPPAGGHGRGWSLVRGPPEELRP
ncbi:hypothetical protein Adu01nite_23890 [Paractinoplanes durhamensis]|uniref:Uncharacterized protein n=1 Tax=Paractinoplanes durhamensis TaxID=113563 RepID=A0ABQ3YU09_9ACTN|nr:hypothetical protein Adu01nite_23890 [Actinoplanes durhamensis]